MESTSLIILTSCINIVYIVLIIMSLWVLFIQLYYREDCNLSLPLSLLILTYFSLEFSYHRLSVSLFYQQSTI